MWAVEKRGDLMAGLFYLLLSLATLFLWTIEPQLCSTEACSSLPGLLGRSWYLWGALFYAIAGILCLSLQKNRPTGAFLTAGAVFHAGLIWYVYEITGSVCPACWKFALAGALLAVSYWILPDRKHKQEHYLLFGPVRALAIIALALVIFNPQSAHPAAKIGPAVESSNEDKPAAVKALKTTPSLPVAEDFPCYLQVFTPDGRGVCLDLQRRPALFFAVWCSHCDGALREAAGKRLEERPHLVATYLQDGDAERVKCKLAGNGLEGEEYYLVESPPAGVQGVPALWDGIHVLNFNTAR
jgi:hypothetical protein